MHNNFSTRDLLAKKVTALLVKMLMTVTGFDKHTQWSFGLWQYFKCITDS